MTVWAKAFAGKIINVQRWSDTHVSSYGGGGYVDPRFGGHVAAAQVSSNVVQRCKIFVKSSDGIEDDFDVSKTTMAFREDHEVFIIWGSISGEESGDYHYIWNKTTKNEIYPEILHDLDKFKDPNYYSNVFPFFHIILIFVISWGIIEFIFSKIFGSPNSFLIFAKIFISFIIASVYYDSKLKKYVKKEYKEESEKRNTYINIINTSISKTGEKLKIKDAKNMIIEHI